MKILLVSQRFRPLIGGAESVMGELSRELVRLGHTVTVLTARWERTWADLERVDGVTIVRLPLPPVRWFGTWWYMRKLRQWLLGTGRRFDVWYVSMLKHSAWVAVGASGRTRVPVVLRAEGSGPSGDVAWQNRSFSGKLIRRRCRRARAIVAITPHVRQELETIRISPERIRDIPNGVPVPRVADDRIAWRHRLGLPATGPLALFIGRLSEEKGLPDLIAAWKWVQAELAEARLAIVGSGPQEEELRRLAAEQHGIIWLGATQQPQRYLRAADLFVLPSYEEGMSIALLEAMASALPIVASDIPGNRTLIDSGHHGLLVPPRRPELLAQSIRVQLQATTLAHAMGRAARQRVEDEFSIIKMAERHLDLFQSLLGTEGKTERR